MNNIVKKIFNIKKIILNYCKDNEKRVIKRLRKLSFKDILYYSLYKESNNLSYSLTNSHLAYKNITEVSKTTLIKRKNSLSSTLFENLNKLLIKHIYKTINCKERFIAVDGSKINLFKSNNNHYKLSKNKNYTTALISSLYDISNKIPINYSIYNSFDEREALCDQLKFCNNNDVLVMDRGYYSVKLAKQLCDNKINFIFRAKKNLKIIKEFEKVNKNNYQCNLQLNRTNTIKIRIIKYDINNDPYYLITNLLDKSKYTINRFKIIYKQRWLVETDFGYSKKYLPLDKIKLNKKNGIEQTIAIINTIQLLDSYIEYLLVTNKKLNKEYKINKNNSMYLFSNKLLRIIFYKKNTNKLSKKLLSILKLINKTIIYSKKNRHYTRIRKLPASSWCLNAIKLQNRFKFRKKVKK